MIHSDQTQSIGFTTVKLFSKSYKIIYKFIQKYFQHNSQKKID